MATGARARARRRFFPDRSWPRVAASLLGLAAVTSAAPSEVLHEWFEPDPEQDLALGATTRGGKLPAALETRSGVVRAPDPGSPQLGTEPSAAGDVGLGTSFHLDGLTMRPDSVTYTDPFRPMVMPFKRLYAFDRVLPDLSLAVSPGPLTPLAAREGGARAGVEPDEDAFFGDFELELEAGTPLRIASVGPGARLLGFEAEPPLPLEFLTDAADNWFVRAEQSGRVRLTIQTALSRQAFGGVFPAASFSDLARAGVRVPALPEEAQRAARRILSHVGASGAETPAHALRILVDYFRRFRDSSEVSPAASTVELYLELSLEQRGVCRHRAYAFMLTALALGIPTRLVHNEAHAWVEVFGGELWHRIDLGGAATRVEDFRAEPEVPLHRTPPDPFSWPEGATPGAGLARASSAAPNPLTDAPARALGPPTASDPDVLVLLEASNSEVRRGESLKVSGRATRAGRACAESRVDVWLRAPDSDAPGILVGSMTTDRRGVFSGEITIPRARAVGTGLLGARLGTACHE